MSVLILGLVIFLGVHSVRIVADDWRTQMVARMSLARWKMVFALIAIVGFVLICWGFGLARQQPTLLYVPPLWLKHVNSLLTLIAFVLVFAAKGPANHIRSAVGHPMVLGAAVWAFGHLLSTGFLHDVVLFGAFLVWAIADYAAARRRDRLAGTVYPRGTLKGDIGAVVIGVVAWVIFALWLHRVLIGVDPFAGLH